MPMDWRAELHAEIVQGGDLERLTEAERISIDEGRSFEAIFNGATNVGPLPWRLPTGKCEIAYVDGDPNPWCRCTATMPAPMEVVLEGMMEIDGPSMRYHERAAFQVLGRPSVHRVNFSLKFRILPMMPTFTWPLSATWASSTTALGKKEYSIVFLPGLTAEIADAQVASTLQLMLLKPGEHAGESKVTYVFQVNFGAHLAALERLMPNARIKVLRQQRELVACIQRHHHNTFWRSQLCAELALGGGLDQLTVAESASIEEGRSFETIFSGATNTQSLPWRLPGGKCEIAYVDGDPNPWCRCTTAIPAAVEVVLEVLWEIDSEATHYHESVELEVLERPSAHSVNWVLRFYGVPMLPAFEVRLSGTWAVSSVDGHKEIAIVSLPTTTEAAEAKGLAAWLYDVEHDAQQRQDRIGALELPSGCVYSAMENELIEKGMGMFAVYESSSASATQLLHSATITGCETKLDMATGLLLGRGTAMVRATPQEVVAYMLNQDGRHNTSLTDRAVFLRFEILQNPNPHHVIVFSRLRLGAGLSERTFLNSGVAKKVAEDPPTYDVVLVPIAHHDKITPKDEAGAVRAENRRSFQLTEVAPGVTKVDYVCSLNAKGSIPQAIVNAIAVPGQMHVLATLQSYFQQIRPAFKCDAEDGRVVGLLLMHLANSKPKDLAHAIREFTARSAMLRECGLRHMGTMLVAMLAAHSTPSDSEHASNRDAAQDLASVSAKHASALGVVLAAVRSGPSQARTQLFAALRQAVDSHPVLCSLKTQHSWFLPMLEVLVALPQAKVYAGSEQSHAASTRQLTLLKPGVRPNTTELTYLFHVNFGSHSTAMAQFLPNMHVVLIRRHRQLLTSINKYFKKEAQAWLNDVEDDGAWRAEMVDHIRHACHVCTEEESTRIVQGTAQLDAFAKGRGKVRSYLHAKTVKMARTKLDKSSGRLIGEVECLIHGASPEDIVAYLMHFESHIRKSLLTPEVVRHEILEVKSSRHAVAFSEMATMPGSRNRTLLDALLWEKVSDSPLTYVWVAVPIADHPKAPSEDTLVRAEVATSCRITQMPGGRTKIEYTFSADWKGHLPELMRTPYDIQRYFLQITPPGDFRAEDGVLLGHLLMDLVATTKGRKRATAIRMFVERTATLRECGFAHLDAFFRGIFEESVLFQLGLGLRKFKTVSVPKAVAVDPGAVTAATAASIGHGFESTVRISATPTDAIDSLLQTYPALGVMAQRHVWFRPMLETVAMRRVAVAPFGLRLRLGIGAVFSIGDMASDLTNIVSMIRAGNSIGAFIMLGLVALNLAVQALVVVLQNAHRERRVVLWELFLVLSLLKPAIDAIRVAGGEERINGAPIDPFLEMAICKGAELTFESIPGGLAQAIFVLNGGHWSTAAVLSIGLSCLSTAFTATMLAYDFDTNAQRRKGNPEFYGYMPDTASKRFLAFVLLFVYHSVCALGKTFSMALLAQTNWFWLVWYLLAEHGGLVLYKLARGDLSYWVPGFGWPVSLLARFMAKVVTDFSGLVHLRHPVELGGLYFFVNSLMNVASWFIAAALYSRCFSSSTPELPFDAITNISKANDFAMVNSSRASLTGADALVGKIRDVPLFATVGTLAVVWLLAVLGLALTIKREYLNTFVSLRTGYADTQSAFLDNEGNDARRIMIFFCNERQWRAIRDRVRQWVLSVYAAWKALMPTWFTTDLQARIPDDFMPAQAVHELNAQAPEGRRPTVQGMDLLRRVSLQAVVSADECPGMAMVSPRLSISDCD